MPGPRSFLKGMRMPGTRSPLGVGMPGSRPIPRGIPGVGWYTRRGMHLPGIPIPTIPVLTSSGGDWSGRYASYSNAYWCLFLVYRTRERYVSCRSRGRSCRPALTFCWRTAWSAGGSRASVPSSTPPGSAASSSVNSSTTLSRSRTYV